MFRIGFPVDAGTAELSFMVLVRLCVGERHSCKHGGTSGLRDRSGAKFIFERCPGDIQKRYCFEFEIQPLTCPKIRPDTLCDVGYSDAAACAVAVALGERSGADQGGDDPLVLISCACGYSNLGCGIANLQLERVTDKFTPCRAGNSLVNKWHAAVAHHALALVLHEDDAAILAEALQRKALPLSENCFRIPSQPLPLLVSCRSDQLPLLVKAFDGSGFLRWQSRKLPKVAMMVVLILALITILTGLAIPKSAITNPQREYDNLARGADSRKKIADLIQFHSRCPDYPINDTVAFLLKCLFRRELRWEASQALAHWNSSVIPSLVKAFEKNPDEQVRWHLVEALRKIGPTSLPTLIAIFRQASVLVKLHICTALGELSRDIRAGKMLLHIQKNEANYRIRWQALHAAYYNECPDLVDNLILGLEDSDARVKGEALIGLCHKVDQIFCGPFLEKLPLQLDRIIQKLELLVQQSNSDLAWLAVDAAAHIAMKRQKPGLAILSKTIRHPQMKTRIHALRSVAQLETSQLPELLVTRPDDDIEIRDLKEILRIRRRLKKNANSIASLPRYNPGWLVKMADKLAISVAHLRKFTWFSERGSLSSAPGCNRQMDRNGYFRADVADI